jgi:hypothetical protein
MHYLQEISAEEVRSVLGVLIKDTPGLADTGFTGAGHFYECPNGHPYVIGECGGAMEESRCPECGARIGGASHSLTAGNRPSQILQGLARGR